MRSRNAEGRGEMRLSDFLNDIDQLQIDRAVKTSRLSKASPLVTIMLITYNHEKYIAQALDSILMQETEFRYEINVIEDCSTDRTQEIVLSYVDKYPHIVKPFFNAVNIGHAVTQRNTYRGFQTLTGDYFAILEGDDFWLDRRRLQKQVAFLEANPDFAICAGNTIKMYEGATGEPHRFLYWGKRADATIEDVINLNPFFHNAGVLFRNCYKGNPPIHFRSRRSCDIFITIAHAQFGKVRHIDEDFAVYRAHPGGRFSNRPKIVEWMFDINGLRHFNAWLNYRYTKAFSRSIVKYCNHVLGKEGRREGGPLALHHRIKIHWIRACYGLMYLVLDAHPLIMAWSIWLGFRAWNTWLGFRVWSSGPLFRILICGRRVCRFIGVPLMPANAAPSTATAELKRKAKYGLDGQPLIVGHTLPEVPRRRLAFSQAMTLGELPNLQGELTWHYIWDLDVRLLPDAEFLDGQPIADLMAVPLRNRHAVCLLLDGLAPKAYRVGIWVKPLTKNTDLHLQLRDSVVPRTGKPAHETDVWYSLSGQTVSRIASGGDVTCGIDAGPDGWLKLWTDIATEDGRFFICPGLVRTNPNTNVFRGSGERLLFGGIELQEAPVASSTYDVREVDARV